MRQSACLCCMQSTEAVSDSKHQQQNDYDTIGAQLARPPARETEPPLTHQARTWQSLSKRVVFLVLFSMAFLHAAYTSFAYTDPADASRCQMAWMSPSYLRMDGLDERHSRLARKYSLWLYREQGWDLSNKVRAEGSLSLSDQGAGLRHTKLQAHSSQLSAARDTRSLCTRQRWLLQTSPKSSGRRIAGLL